MTEVAAKLEGCPDCAGQISTKAAFCPHCGAWFGDGTKGIDVVVKRRVDIVVRRIDMGFLNLTGFLFQVAIAAVPAAILVAIFWSFLWGLMIGAFTKPSP